MSVLDRNNEEDSEPLWFESKLWISNGDDNEDKPYKSRRGRVEFISNVLRSPRLEMGLVWFPKGMCTTLRQLFINIQHTLNPNFYNEHTKIHIHKLHNKKRFQYRDEKTTPVKKLWIVLRDPMERFLSTYFDKHVVKRQWLFLATHNYHKFRLWLDVNNLNHTMENFVRFVETHHFLDVHDAPISYQFPYFLVDLSSSSGSGSGIHDKRTTTFFLMNEKNLYQKMVDDLHHHLEKENVLPTRQQKIIEEAFYLLSSHPQNSLPHAPVSPNSSPILPSLSKITSTTTSKLLVWMRKNGGFPAYTTILSSVPKPFLQSLHRLYSKDLELFHHPRRSISHSRLHPHPHIWENYLKK